MTQQCAVDNGRDTRLTAYVEEELAQLATRAAEKSNTTVSLWLRNLVVQELTRSGVLTQETLLRMVLSVR